MPMLMATMLLGLWAVGIVVANIRCIDAARDAARAVARGESTTTAQRLGERAAPAGALVRMSQEGSTVRVVVRSESKLDWALINKLPAIPVEGHATIEFEPGTQPAMPGPQDAQPDASQIEPGADDVRLGTHEVELRTHGVELRTHGVELRTGEVVLGIREVELEPPDLELETREVVLGTQQLGSRDEGGVS